MTLRVRQLHVRLFGLQNAQKFGNAFIGGSRGKESFPLRNDKLNRRKCAAHDDRCRNHRARCRFLNDCQIGTNAKDRYLQKGAQKFCRREQDASPITGTRLQGKRVIMSL